jgi:malonate-semialdehyde dehydrogenase (acetylating)/methylmalonate-semialdehyde dehydrogenase
MVPVGDIHEATRERMVAHASAYRLGDGAAEGTTMGPVVTAVSRDRINGMIEREVSRGGTRALDGRGVTAPDRPNGFYVSPTIVDNVTADTEMGTEEVFGPVAASRRSRRSRTRTR